MRRDQRAGLRGLDWFEGMRRGRIWWRGEEEEEESEEEDCGGGDMRGWCMRSWLYMYDILFAVRIWNVFSM